MVRILKSTYGISALRPALTFLKISDHNSNDNSRHGAIACLPFAPAFHLQPIFIHGSPPTPRDIIAVQPSLHPHSTAIRIPPRPLTTDVLGHNSSISLAVTETAILTPIVEI